MNFPTFSRFTGLVTNFAARTFAVAGATAALSPVAMAADPAAANFGAGHFALAFAAGTAALKGIQSLRTRFAVKSPLLVSTPTVASAATSIVNVLSTDANFNAAKQAALSRPLPPLGDMKLPPGVKLVEVPGATYMMGGKRETTVSSVYWPTTANSNDLVKHLMPDFVPLPGLEEGNLPANLSWDQSQELVRLANEQYPGPKGTRWRLPTEAEYERATRGRNLNATDAVDPRKVNVYASGNGKALAVDAAGHANDLGLVHIRGNVWGWCEDGYDDLSKTAIVNPQVGRTESGSHVLRGGSYLSSEDVVRLAYRDYRDPDYRYHYIGSWLVLAPEAE